GSANAVCVFDDHGAFVVALAGTANWQPGALAVRDSRIYVADAAAGEILAFEDSGTWQGNLPGYRGPVTAMATNAGGDLYVKTGLDATYVVLQAGAAFVATGSLEAGPFDAGETREWEWARLDASLPAGTQCVTQGAQLRAPLPLPLPGPLG